MRTTCLLSSGLTGGALCECCAFKPLHYRDDEYGGPELCRVPDKHIAIKEQGVLKRDPEAD